MRNHNVKRALESHTQGYAKRLRDVEHALSQAQEQMLRQQYDVASTLKSLARLKLASDKPLNNNAVSTLLDQRRQQELDLRSQLQETDKAISQALNSQLEQRNRVAEATDRLPQLQVENADFQAAAGIHAGAVKTEQLASLLHTDISDEVSRKQAEFKQNPLFSYLHGQAFGTAQYNSHGLRCRLDQWIARLVNYPTNRNSFDMLFAIEAESRRRHDEAKAALTTAALQRDKVMAGISDSLGIPQLLQAQAEIDARVRALKERARSIQDEIATFGRLEDPMYQKAVFKLADDLERQNVASLLQDALQTSGQGDDELVHSLTRLQASLKATEKQIASLTADRKARAEEVNRARQLERHLNDRYLYSSRYEYRGLDTGDLFTGYMLGQISLDSASREVESHRSVIHEPETSRTNWGCSSAGGSSFSTSSSSGGGDYSTTDSF